MAVNNLKEISKLKDSMTPAIALVGCGRWGQNILRDLISLNCKVIVVDPSAQSREDAKKAGAFSTIESINELPPTEGSIVAAPTTLHASVIKQLLVFNRPIFVEKPLTTDPKEAIELVKLANGRLFMMDKWRYHPGIETLTQISRSEELGPLLGISMKRVGWGNSQNDCDCVWTLGPHDLSIALEILGYIPEPLHAIAEIDGDKFMSMTGILGKKPCVMFDISSRTLEKQRSVRIHCQKGTASLYDSDHGHIHLITQSTNYLRPKEEWRPVSNEQPLLRELKAFLGFLNGGVPPKSSGLDGAKIVGTLAELRELAKN